jgi:hypothetical protein
MFEVPILVLLLFVLFYKRDVKPCGTVWLPPEVRERQAANKPAIVNPPVAAPPAEPLDLNDVFRRRA